MILEHDAIILGTFYPKGSEIECSEETAQQGYKQAVRAVTRIAIAEETKCDDSALLGVALDSIHVLTYAAALIYKVIGEANSLKEIKAGLADMQDLSHDFLNKVETGEIKLPYLTVKKGVAPVFTDLAETATATTRAMLSLNGERNEEKN